MNQSANIFVRIRPNGKDGGHAVREQVGDKKLHSWDESKLTVHDNQTKKNQKFTYPAAIVHPEHDQEETYQAIMPDMIESFLQGFDCTFMAYGQTGTGKTHTMFGPPQSLKSFGQSGEVEPNWGLLPRALVDIM